MQSELISLMPEDLRSLFLSRDGPRFMKLLSQSREWYDPLPQPIKDYFSARWSVYTDLLGTSRTIWSALLLTTDSDGSSSTAAGLVTMAQVSRSREKNTS